MSRIPPDRLFLPVAGIAAPPAVPDYSLETAALKRSLRHGCLSVRLERPHGPASCSAAFPDGEPVSTPPVNSFIAGLDEAGRGPLAGPVVAAAVALDADNIPEGLNDSKKLTAERRNALFDVILAAARVSIASSSAAHIDRSDIRRASLDAMRRALAGLSDTPNHALFDGCDVPSGIAVPGEAVVRGDGRSLSIAAASIVAKVMRDRMMARLDQVYPGYGFALHAGYPTASHRQAIAVLGPCPLHRMTFRPLRRDPA